MSGGELTQAIWPDKDCVACMDDSGFDDARDDGTHKRHGKGVIDMKLERGIGVIVAMVGKDVEERANEVERFTGDVGDLKDGADALGDELGGGLDSIGTVFDEDGDLPCAGGLEDAGQLGDRLLQDLRWANVNLGDDHHHRNVQSKGDAKMLSDNESAFTVCLWHMASILAHPNETVVCSDHEQTIVGTAAE